MIEIDNSQKKFTLTNNALSLDCSFKNGLIINKLCNRFGSISSNENRELFELTFCGKKLTTADFKFADIVSGDDATRELITLRLDNKEVGLSLRIHFLSDKKETINIIIQVKDRYKNGEVRELLFHSPFLAEFEYEGYCDKIYYPAAPAVGSLGKSVIKMMNEAVTASDIKLPLTVISKENGIGFAVSFPFESDLIDVGSAQNRNVMLTEIKNADELKNHLIPLAPDDNFADSVEFEITGLKNGWPEAFSRSRDKWRANYDFTEYKKDDLNWFNTCVVNNFTFLYGSEGRDEKTGLIDAKKLAESGKAFGGYDTVTLWNQYPRLGIDSRDQFAFYDDYPGGRESIKKAVCELHREGIKVFLPYIPWDRRSCDSDEDMSKRLAGLARDTDCDGFQFDTLDSVPDIFREKLNEVRPGIVLTTQKHPQKKHPLEIITTSWDEFFTSQIMPRTDILRYMLPEHLSPVIARWARLEDKDELIKYAVFGAAPIVIWQDIFGRIMPFSDEQRKTIKKWKSVYLENRDIYQCKNPIPLYPMLIPLLFCNYFQADDGKEIILSLYYDSDEPSSGDIMRIDTDFSYSVRAIFGDCKTFIKDGFLKAELPSRQVLHLKITKN